MNYILELIGLSNLTFNEFLWVSFGTIGQLVFFSRWLIQWISSEKSKTSYIPVAFWWCSLLGGIITLIYAHHIGNFHLCWHKLLELLYIQKLVINI